MFERSECRQGRLRDGREDEGTTQRSEAAIVRDRKENGTRRSRALSLRFEYAVKVVMKIQFKWVRHSRRSVVIHAL